MLKVDLYIDGKIVCGWTCPTVNSPASRHGSLVAGMQFEEEGCELRPADLPQAEDLWRQCHLPDAAVKSGVYFPTDGVKFLIAMAATYGRGSRMWAVITPDKPDEGAAKS